MSTYLSKLEILNETIKFYSKDVKCRAINGFSCSYNTEDGRHCAVGRCLLPKYHKKGSELLGNNGAVGTLVTKNDADSLDKLLQKKYRGHSDEFWAYMQSLHDNPKNWEANGLTQSGFNYVEKIKDKFAITE